MKKYFIFLLLIRITIILAILTSIWEKSWITLFVSCLTLSLTLLPYFIQKNYKIKLPLEIQIVTVLFIYSALFLGFVREWYIQIWWWNYLMHAFSGIALGFVGFFILYTLYKTGKLQANYFLISLFSFCFALALGGLWEIFEFTIDSIFKEADMQNTKTIQQLITHGSTRLAIYDTMWDLILDALGALIASFSGYLYLKNQETFLFNRIIKKFEKLNKFN